MTCLSMPPPCLSLSLSLRASTPCFSMHACGAAATTPAKTGKPPTAGSPAGRQASETDIRRIRLSRRAARAAAAETATGYAVHVRRRAAPPRHDGDGTARVRVEVEEGTASPVTARGAASTRVPLSRPRRRTVKQAPARTDGRKGLPPTVDGVQTLELSWQATSQPCRAASRLRVRNVTSSQRR